MSDQEIVQAIKEKLTMAIEYDASNNPIYIGEAPTGSAQTAALWRIRKVTYDGHNNPISVVWAGGTTAFDKKWSERITYQYS
jgi:YD repeat-containing protein